jgi:surface protein
MEGVKGVAIPDCTYQPYPDNARTCGIRQAVDAYISGSTGSYGLIEDWDTSLVTDMSAVFRDKSNFNADISKWKVGKVTRMDYSTYILLFLFFTSPLLHKIGAFL